MIIFIKVNTSLVDIRLFQLVILILNFKYIIEKVLSQVGLHIIEDTHSFIKKNIKNLTFHNDKDLKCLFFKH